MELLRLNTPRYFAPEEAADLDAYLERERELYYVLLHEERIVGCGGINFADGGTVGKISWDMVHPQYRGKSLERGMLRHRIEKLKRCAASAESPSERRSWPSGFTKSGGSSSKGSKRTIGPKDSTCIAWNMSVGNKSRRRQGAAARRIRSSPPERVRCARVSSLPVRSGRCGKRAGSSPGVLTDISFFYIFARQNKSLRL